MPSFTFGKTRPKQELQHIAKTDISVQSKHTTLNTSFVTRSHLQICTGNHNIPIFIQFKSAHGLCGCYGEQFVNFRIEIPQLFHHPFDRQSLSIFITVLFKRIVPRHL